MTNLLIDERIIAFLRRHEPSTLREVRTGFPREDQGEVDLAWRRLQRRGVLVSVEPRGTWRLYDGRPS